jgi:hypothetical protein
VVEILIGKKIKKMVSASIELAETLNKKKIVESDTTRCTGVVWEAAKKVQQVPKSNRVAFRR